MKIEYVFMMFCLFMIFLCHLIVIILYNFNLGLACIILTQVIMIVFALFADRIWNKIK